MAHRSLTPKHLNIAAWIGALILIITASVALAAVTFTSIVFNGCSGGNCTVTAVVSAMSNPDKQVCLQYATTDWTGRCTGVINSSASTVPCTCTGANCNNGVGSWACSFPGSNPASTYWMLGSWTGGGNCGSLATFPTAPSGCGSASPLAVTLAAFTADATPAGVILAWETVSETDNVGFNVYRAEGGSVGPTGVLREDRPQQEQAAGGSVGDRPQRAAGGAVGDRPQQAAGGSVGDRPQQAAGGAVGDRPQQAAGARSETGPSGEWTRLNAALIPSAAPGSSEGHAYTWTDATALPGLDYAYLLEDVALDGTPTRHAPVTVAAAGQPNAVGLVRFAGTTLPRIEQVLALAGLAVLALVASALAGARRGERR